MRLEDLMERAAQYDETLARDIKDYVHGRKYGLVYEASKPEFVRMWKKPVVRGDIVNILPPRGEMEDTKSEDDPSEIVYKVISINGGVVKLRNEETGEQIEASIDDVVALARFDKPIYGGLREVGRVERGGDKPYHVVINGENYHALQTLVYAYQGLVDCIYIDPPYNTGASDWKYNNNYVGKDDQYRHSKWLTFMEDRLKLAKKLLNPKDSVLIVTIDEKEYLRLGLLLEQLFPEGHIQMVTSMVNKKAATRQQEFSRAGEFLYFVMLGKANPSNARLNMMTGELNDDKKPISYEGLRRRGGKRKESPGCFYPVFINGDGTLHSVGMPIGLGVDRHTVIPPDGTWAAWPINADDTESRWQINRDRFLEQLKNSTLVLSSFEKERESATVLYLKNADLKKIENGDVRIIGKDDNGQLIAEWAADDSLDNSPKSIWVMNSHDASVYGTTLHKRFIPDSDFAFPKSLYAVEDCLRFFIDKKPDALVIDFFAGSGTTAHAVMRLNHQDGGCRRSISVTNNEVNSEEVDSFTAQGLRPGDEEWERHGICRSVTIPRLTAAITGVTSKGKPIKGKYGIEREIYVLDEEAQLISKSSGKPLKRNVYLKKKIQDPSVPDPFSMADGFDENALFFDLEYLEPTVVNADLAFDNIAPILWMCGGCKGDILKRYKGYAISQTYAILFDPRYTKRFVDAITDKHEVNTVFIVTDSAERYRSLCAELPGCRVMQLYESYLRSFEINAIG